MLTDAERLELWDDLIVTKENHCKALLNQVLIIPDGQVVTIDNINAMRTLFFQYGFQLGQISQFVHHKILRAFIEGTTRIDLVHLFFHELGGSFYTNPDQNICVWNEIAQIEIKTTAPSDYNEFLQKLGRIETLVRHLVDHFEMPVNPVKRFDTRDLARTLDMARSYRAWMLYYALSSYYIHLDRQLLLTKRDIELDPRMDVHVKEFWYSCPSLPDNRVAPNVHSMADGVDDLVDWISRPEIFRESQVFMP